MSDPAKHILSIVAPMGNNALRRTTFPTTRHSIQRAFLLRAVMILRRNSFQPVRLQALKLTDLTVAFDSMIRFFLQFRIIQ
jgi:hypothetical protein